MDLTRIDGAVQIASAWRYNPVTQQFSDLPYMTVARAWVRAPAFLASVLE